MIAHKILSRSGVFGNRTTSGYASDAFVSFGLMFGNGDLPQT
jgi:hypothetical protein